MGHADLSPAAVAAQVAELLGVAGEAVDPAADLAGQGLDSIRMMALAGRWRRQGLDVDFAALAQEPTVAAWSELLATAVPAPETGIEPAAESQAEPFPLAPMQHAMWVGRECDQQLGGVAGHLYVEFDGAALDPDRLRAAAAALAARHPMLRVEFLADGTQRIRPTSEYPVFPVAVEDLRELAEPVVAQRLAETRDAKSHQQLDRAVFELTLSQLPGGRTRLHVDLDMQAADAMSYRTLMSDLAALYRAAGDPAAAVPPVLDYTYAEYRRQTADRQPDEAHRRWWAERIPELPDAPRLPAPVGRPANPCRTTRRWHWLDPQTRDALFARAQAHGVTPAMTLAASFSDAVARWSAEPRFLLNVPLFGRDPLHADVDLLVGDFTSSLLLDVDLTGAATATARAHAVQEAMRTAAAHSNYPGLSVLRDLSRHRGTQVLAPVVFTSALGLGELFGAEVTETFGAPSWIVSQGPQVLLDAQVTEFDGGLLVNWDVREEMFAPGVIDAMFAHHVDELRRLAGDADSWDAPASAELPPGQREVRDAVNGKAAAGSAEALHHGFFRRAAEQPDALAVCHDSGPLTYRQLREQALAVAVTLRDNGVRSGDTVALLGPKSVEQIPALLGILAAGGAYLPIGADQPADRARRMLDIGGVRAVLTTGAEIPDLPVPVMAVGDAVRAGRDGAAVDPLATDPGALAYVVFTSGSTGEPKGVEVTHDAAMNTVEFLNGHFGIGPSDRCLALLALEADMSVLDVFGTLRAGGAIVPVDEADRRNPDAWARLVDTHRVSVLNLMPGSLEMLLATAGELSSVRVVPTGGDWVRPELVHRLRRRAPGVRFAGLGGATETAIHATIFEIGGHSAPSAQWPAVPYGTPFPNMACRVVSPAGRDCPDWVAGELWFSGRGLARGYRGRDDLTAERFVEHDGRTWYRTGDLARYWTDGTLEFLGRADHRIKVSGYRIELGEVEAALQRIPGVLSAVAAVVSGGTDQLAAAISVDGPDVTVEQVRAALAELVPAHMVPSHLSVVTHIPYTLSGKVDRRAVQTELVAAVAAGAGSQQRSAQTPLQGALAAIFAELLGCTVGIDDDFFALGGDSVLATAVIARIRAWLDVADAMVPDIFATRTVAALADRLIGREPDATRLDLVAEVYLEVAQMDSVDVLAAVGEN